MGTTQKAPETQEGEHRGAAWAAIAARESSSAGVDCASQPQPSGGCRAVAH